MLRTKKRRHLLSAGIIAGIAAGMTAGLCGCGGEAKDNGEQGEGMPPVTFTFYNADGSEDPWTDPVARKITEATGVTLKTEYPSNGQDNNILLMVATREYPDLIFAKGDSNILIDNGALIDMSELIEEYGPHIKALYGGEYDSLRYSKEDPAVYQLCSNKVGDEVLTTAGTAQLQWAVLAENNYAIPHTLEEYTEMIRNYMEENPYINGQKTIGISISCTDWHWYTTLSDPAGYIANGATDDGQWIVDEENTVYYKHAMEEQKEYFRWLNRMYREGILDPDFATQTHEDYIGKIASGRVLGLLDADWDITAPESSLKARGLYERTYAGLPVTIDESVTCAVLREQNLGVGWGVGISVSCKDPVRAVQFLDWMCTEEAQVLLNWGIEGVNYFYDENGVRYRTPEEIEQSETNTNYGEETGVGRHNYPFPAYGNTALDSTGNHFTTNSRELIISEYNSVQRAALEAWGVEMLIDIFPRKEEFEKKYYSPIWAKVLPSEVKKLQNALDEAAWPGLINCIVCPPDSFDYQWEKLQNELAEAGRYEAEALMTELIRAEAEFRKSME
ncbi:MAG: extracellular solute-binding protein [Butyrivibrio sp.]|nr:extracellular solute-binding protein [Acetatifactor muris]MCM1561181.1 extracellular solute-binding protein [Butyrivibrio sp.]